MQNYELMVIFTPVLSEEDFKAAQKKFVDFIKSNSGEIELEINASEVVSSAKTVFVSET